MIEVVSLLFGLVGGLYTVELSAAGPVAELELRLDGRTVDVLESPPWLFECDFGVDLMPHELEAVARDAEGRELDRVRKWVNLQQQPNAEAAMIFSGGERGQPREVGLVWESIGQRWPRSIQLELDGEPLTFTDPARVPLPAYDPEEMHFVSATLRFRDETVSRLEASFGGISGSEIQTELTAVAIVLDKKGKTPRPADLQGAFLVGGKPVTVHGVEAGEAEVVVVRDPAAQPVLEELVRLLSFSMLGAGGRSSHGSLGRNSFLRVMSPAGAPLSPDEVTPEMFVWSDPHDAGEEGLLWLSQRQRPQSFALKFANAVALSGMQAHASTRRRAVVLLLGGSPTELDIYSPAAARNYLRLLQVPLFAWTLRSEPPAEWPDARAIELIPDLRRGHQRLMKAVKELRATLDAQRIVWLEGSYLPQAVELAPQAKGFRLAGSEP